MTEKVWFISGASRGFGRIWTEAALARGDRVAATARNVSALADLIERYPRQVLTLPMDVTDPKQVELAIIRTHRLFGRIDIVLNNAGYGLLATVEEASLDEIKAEFDTNFYGAVHVLQSVLPILREQGRGHILAVSSLAGVICYPFSGYYNASKWALEALHESLSLEVADFGIHVTIVEPGSFATNFVTPSSLKIAHGYDVYEALRERMFSYGAQLAFGDPHSTAGAIMKIVDAKEPPLRVFLGSEGLPAVKEAYMARLAEWEEWADISNAAQGESCQMSVVNKYRKADWATE